MSPGRGPAWDVFRAACRVWTLNSAMLHSLGSMLELKSLQQGFYAYMVGTACSWMLWNLSLWLL